MNYFITYIIKLKEETLMMKMKMEKIRRITGPKVDAILDDIDNDYSILSQLTTKDSVLSDKKLSYVAAMMANTIEIITCHEDIMDLLAINFNALNRNPERISKLFKKAIINTRCKYIDRYVHGDIDYNSDYDFINKLTESILEYSIVSPFDITKAYVEKTGIRCNNQNIKYMIMQLGVMYIAEFIMKVIFSCKFKPLKLCKARVVDDFYDLLNYKRKEFTTDVTIVIENLPREKKPTGYELDKLYKYYARLQDSLRIIADEYLFDLFHQFKDKEYDPFIYVI
jgi:hypothetical protein